MSSLFAYECQQGDRIRRVIVLPQVLDLALLIAARQGSAAPSELVEQALNNHWECFPSDLPSSRLSADEPQAERTLRLPRQADHNLAQEARQLGTTASVIVSRVLERDLQSQVPIARDRLANATELAVR
jgi:hypothetical protein